jgi:hypothetical protein
MIHKLTEKKSPNKLKKNNILPADFRQLLWSYDFPKIDPINDKKTIIINTINYGDLKHWRWISAYYGQKKIKQVLITAPATELRPGSLKLASIIFSLNKINYAPRSAN